MKFIPTIPPRPFNVGPAQRVELTDCAHIHLAADEQVTFVTESEAEYDVVRKSWGFYATPSLNRRLVKFGWRSCLVRSSNGSVFINLVERAKAEEFQTYCREQEQPVVCWLDNEEDIQIIARAFGASTS